MAGDYEQTFRRIEAQLDAFFASNRTDDEKRLAANEALLILAHLNREIAEQRGIGKESQLSPKHWPLRIPLHIKKEIARGNKEAILSLLENEERRSNGASNGQSF